MKTQDLLGPFIGNVTETGVKIWLHAPHLAQGETLPLTVTLHEGQPDAAEAVRGRLLITYESLNVGILTFDSLKPGTTYYYRLLQDNSDKAAAAATVEDASATVDGAAAMVDDATVDDATVDDAAATTIDGERALRLVELPDLTAKDLYFRTLPSGGYENQLDFLLMSCHNPETAKDDGLDGFGVWAQIPQIMLSNENVRFAILAGDQAYGDEVEAKVLTEQDERRRQNHYLDVYRKFWNNKHYRKVLCSLPAVSMWDDHDITDGWGSREDSYKDKEAGTFLPEWQRLFETASSVFKQMQAARNPDPLSPNYKDGLDFCFKVGQAAFAVADLRTNRNVKQKRMWKPEQLENIRRWVDENKQDIHTLFFVSSVVFSHGAPQIEQRILRSWFHVLDVARWLGKFKTLKRPAQWFDHTVGDLRDDINDSWGAEVNEEETERVLDFLFGLQNSDGGVAGKGIKVVILSGDIHTPGYSTLYSDDPNHKSASIPHIVASPVAYQPFSWVGEAIFRHLTRVVELGVKRDANGKPIDKEKRAKGEKGKSKYTAQVSHHFCYRNVVVVSLRNYEQDESHLKVKYYLEGFPEPQVMLFDLNHGSRREAIKWPEKAKENAEQPNLA